MFPLESTYRHTGHPFLIELLALNSTPLPGETCYECNSTAEQLPPQSYNFLKHMSQPDYQEYTLLQP